MPNEEWHIIEFINDCYKKGGEAVEYAHTNKRMFEVLYYFYGGEILWAKRELWSAKVSEIEYKQQIPHLLRQGHSFWLFEKYASDMLLYGLPLSMKLSQYKNELNIEEANKQEKVKEWIQQNKGIPMPIVNGTVSAEFLLIGNREFNP